MTEPPRGEHVAEPPRGEHVAEPPRGEHVAEPPRGERVIEPPRGEHVAEPPRGERAAAEPPVGGRPAGSPWRALAVYTGVRVATFAVALGVLALVGFRSYALVLAALLVAAVVSLVAFRRQRAAVSRSLAALPAGTPRRRPRPPGPAYDPYAAEEAGEDDDDGDGPDRDPYADPDADADADADADPPRRRARG